jgi:hypothetical protein
MVDEVLQRLMRRIATGFPDVAFGHDLRQLGWGLGDG